jgi:hypothetical protein
MAGIWAGWSSARPAANRCSRFKEQPDPAGISLSTTVRHGDQVCALMMARRQPGSGKVIWLALLNAAGDTSNEIIQAEVAAVIADLRAQTGIPAE